MSSISTVSYLLLFAVVGVFFLLASLTLGWLVRPKAPSSAKLATYECGEESVGSSYVQFDLRFYVVALVFIIFDVEVAFFFPWATVFGKATQLFAAGTPQVVRMEAAGTAPKVVPSPTAAEKLRSMGVRNPAAPNPAGSVEMNNHAMAATMRRLAAVAMVDIAVFFVVLLVGFAYVWSRGDLDWVRAIGYVGQRSAGQPAGVEMAVGVTRST